MLEGEYLAQEAALQMRMEPHQLMDEPMVEWKRTSDLQEQLKASHEALNEAADDQISLIDPRVRQDKAEEISFTLRQLQLKHQQLMRAMRTQEELQADALLAKQAQRVKGQYGEALSGLLKLLSSNDDDLEQIHSGINDVSKETKQLKKLNIKL